MIDINGNSIKNLIFSVLQSGPAQTKNLIQEVQGKRPHTTRQAVYKVLRMLKKQEVVVVNRKSVSLNATWVSQMRRYFALVEHRYLKDRRNTGDLLDLQNGEKIRYDFKTAASTDAFWIHALHILLEANPKPVWFGYNPHCWFFIARAESERALRDLIKRKGGVYVMTVGGKMALDKYIRKEFDGEQSKYYMRDRPLFARDNYYVNVVEDFIIEVWIDKKVADRIEDLYRRTKAYSEDVKKELEGIINSRGKSKLIISRNQAKAKELIKRFAKPFVLSL